MLKIVVFIVFVDLMNALIKMIEVDEKKDGELFLKYLIIFIVKLFVFFVVFLEVVKI